MNCITITGVVEKDAEIKTGKSTLLEFTVITLRKGFGQYADRIFQDKVKVISFGRDLQALANQLTAGTWVEVIGEAGVEAWVDRSNKEKAHGRLKVTAKTVTVSIFEVPESGAPRPAAESSAPAAPQAQNEAPPQEQDDVPF